MPKLQKKNAMSSSTPTWASVVANGIRNGPTYPTILPMPDKSLPWNLQWHMRPSEAKGKRVLPPVMSSPGRNPATLPTSLRTEQLASRGKETLELDDTVNPQGNAYHRAHPYCATELPTSMRIEQQPGSSIDTMELDDTMNTSYPKMNSQAMGNRSRRHPRCPAPMNWRSRGARPQMPRNSFGSLLESDSFCPGRSMCLGAQAGQVDDIVDMDDSQSNNNYNTNDYNNIHINGLQQHSSLDTDPIKRPSVSTSPRERNRCQVTFVSGDYSATSWQMVGNSRQVWEPLLPNQRGNDPSNPMPPPPPGFGLFKLGRRLLSNRTRQLLGEQIDYWHQAEYATPEPMIQPDRPLREQLHFIGNHDTHLTCRPSQLRVTNGATGDGYYVRPGTNQFTNDIKKQIYSPKNHPMTFPKISYWELLRRNEKSTDMEMETSLNNGDQLIASTESVDQNINRDNF